MINISIIIPTYNEKENIKKLIISINKILKKDFEIIIVDDHSPDGTGKIVDELSKKYPVKCVHRKGKLGLSSAVIEGFKAAKGPVIGVMDADFSHDINIVPQLIKPIINNEAELTIGSRYIKGGEIENWPLKRKVISRGATLLSLPLTKIKDPMSGFFFLKKEVIEGIELNAKGYKILLEIIVKGSYDKVKEIPYTFVDRKSGKSKLNKSEYIDYLKNLFNLIKYKYLTLP